jgi:hypothetical protein
MAARRQRLLGTTLSARGEILQRLKESLLTSFEVVAYGALLLLLPCVVADRIFDWMLAETLTQVMLVAVAGTAILTTIAVHEGWYLEHLSEWGLARARVEPDLSAESRTDSNPQHSDRARSGEDQVGTTIIQPTNPANAQSTPAAR